MTDPPLALLLSLGFVLAGPLLAWLLERWARLRAALDGFVLVSVAGICICFLLPHAWEALGAWALLLAGLGLLLPALAERGLDDHGGRASRAVLLLALGGLLLHTFIDGVALGAGGVEHDHLHPQHHEGLEVTVAILLHRLPVGLLIWTTVRPWLGRAGAWAVLGAVVATTLGGYALGGGAAHAVEDHGAGVVDALLAGGLLHVVIDEHHTDPAPRGLGQLPAAAGASLGLLLFVLLPFEPPAFLGAAWAAGVGLFCESAPPVLLGFLAAGLLSLVPTAVLARLMQGKTALGSALRGVIFGLPIPICSCGVVPVYAGLMRKGVPAAAGVAFLIATPELGVDAVAISLPLLGWELTLVRLGAAFALAAAAGLAVHWLSGGGTAPASPAAPACGGEGSPTQGSRTARALRYGFVEAFDDLGPWILAGVAVAALLEPLLDPDSLASVPRAAQVPLFAGLAAPFYVCASAATPLAAVLLAKGLGAGAAVAFLLAGPATNVTTYGALRRFHGRGTTLLALGFIVAACVVLGLVAEALPLDESAWSGASGHTPAPWEGAAGAVFAALLFASLARQGPRGFLRRLGLAHGHGEGGTVGDAPHGGPAGGGAVAPSVASAAGSGCCAGEAETDRCEPKAASGGCCPGEGASAAVEPCVAEATGVSGAGCGGEGARSPDPCAGEQP
ncbi:MAG: hypothetical protein D6731_04190 [Planctomycetota bacterium]|nr:MAG: hypothetical protein D6731_04190 [Planctomycetota bacterium]